MMPYFQLLFQMQISLIIHFNMTTVKTNEHSLIIICIDLNRARVSEKFCLFYLISVGWDQQLGLNEVHTQLDRKSTNKKLTKCGMVPAQIIFSL